MRKFIIGSNYFFRGYPGFHPHDKDYLILEENPKDYKNNMSIRGQGLDYIYWRKMSPREFINRTLITKLPMQVGKFLIPEVCKEIGFTLDNLKELKPVIDKLDDKHKYEQIIYESYIENNDFVLTQEQRDRAYKCYKESR